MPLRWPGTYYPRTLALNLTVRSGTSSQDFGIEDGATLGRAADNDIVLDSPEVSRHHATFSGRDGAWEVTDLGSANGTVIRGQHIEPRVATIVRSGDRITMGPFEIEVTGSGTQVGSQATVIQPRAEATAVWQPAGMSTMVADGGATSVFVPKPRLVITSPAGTAEVPLDRDQVTFGREPANDVVIEDDVVSRRHLAVRRTPQGLLIEDLGSRNGLSMAGGKIKSRILQEGDVFDIGGVIGLRFTQMPAEMEASGGGELDIEGDTDVVIGRAPDCGLTLDHPMVSLHHARLIRAGKRETIEDLGSTNGTFVNADRLIPGAPHALVPGDVIRVGPIRLTMAAGAIEHKDESREIGINAVALRQQVTEKVNLLQDISFSIRPQEFVAVVGGSGAGKSTLLGALSGLKPATGGSVLLNGSPLYENFGAFRTTLGYVPQDDILHKELPVERALQYAAALRLPDDTSTAERNARVTAVLATLGLDQRKDVAISRLSGGQRKRVSIGAELLTQPGLFFLDEATSGLDPGTESQLMRLLRKLADDGHTIVLITHATKNVMLCDQVAFLARGGYLAYYGPPDKALTYFEVTDFDGIYEKLDGESTPEEWGARYARSPLYQEYVRSRLEEDGVRMTPGVAAQAPARGDVTSVPRVRKSSSIRQWLILARRYFDIIRRDRINLALLFLLAPAIGALDFALWDRKILTYQAGDGPQAMTMLFLAALFPFLVGALSNVREIVKEAAIYLRERAVSLQIWPYLASKMSVGLLFALFHAAAMLGIKILAVEFPNADLTGYAEAYVTIVLSVMSGVMWALVISALTSREEQAMMLAIGIIVLQVVFSGGLVPLADLGVVGTVLGGITSTSWSYKALTSASGLSLDGCSGDNLTNCRLPGFGSFENDDQRRLGFDAVNEQFGGVFGADVLVCWGAMLAIIAGLGMILWFLQKRKDTL